MTEDMEVQKLKHQVQDPIAGRGDQTLSYHDSGFQPQLPGSTRLQALEHAVEQTRKVSPGQRPWHSSSDRRPLSTAQLEEAVPRPTLYSLD